MASQAKPTTSWSDGCDRVSIYGEEKLSGKSESTTTARFRSISGRFQAKGDDRANEAYIAKALGDVTCATRVRWNSWSTGAEVSYGRGANPEQISLQGNSR